MTIVLSLKNLLVCLLRVHICCQQMTTKVGVIPAYMWYGLVKLLYLQICWPGLNNGNCYTAGRGNYDQRKGREVTTERVTFYLYKICMVKCFLKRPWNFKSNFFFHFKYSDKQKAKGQRPRKLIVQQLREKRKAPPKTATPSCEKKVTLL